jgi:hypothetical protein
MSANAGDDGGVRPAAGALPSVGRDAGAVGTLGAAEGARATGALDSWAGAAFALDSCAGAAFGARFAAVALGLIDSGAGVVPLCAGAAEGDAGDEPLDALRPAAMGPRGPVVFCGAGLAFCAPASSRAFALASAAAASLSRAAAITGGDDVASPGVRAGDAGDATGFGG